MHANVTNVTPMKRAYQGHVCTRTLERAEKLRFAENSIARIVFESLYLKCVHTRYDKTQEEGAPFDNGDSLASTGPQLLRQSPASRIVEYLHKKQTLHPRNRMSAS